MSRKCNLWYLIRGFKLKFCWLELGAKCDFEIFYNSLTTREQKKVIVAIEKFSENGMCWNKEISKKITDNIYEIKAGQIRIPFFFHKAYQNHIVITHMFKKKRDKWPQTEVKRAEERMIKAQELDPKEPE